MKVLYVASEAVPFAKTGGLADVAGSLPQALHENDVDVRVIMPKFGMIDKKYVDEMEHLYDGARPDPGRTTHAGLGTYEKDSVPY